MELFFRDRLDRREGVDTGIVDQDVEAAESLDGRGDDPLRIGFLRYVAAHGNGLATCLGNGRNDLVRVGFARRIVDDDRSAFGGE